MVCSKGGDCLARYLVRMEEMLESVKIIDQAIENLPPGPVNSDVEAVRFVDVTDELGLDFDDLE